MSVNGNKMKWQLKKRDLKNKWIIEESKLNLKSLHLHKTKNLKVINRMFVAENTKSEIEFIMSNAKISHLF